MASPYKRFIRARDFLQQHRTDYATAYRDYEPPELDEFNWALDYFDTQAQGNTTPALWVVEQDGSERKISFADMAARSSQVANWLRACGVRRGDRVLLMLPNRVELWEIMLAGIKLARRLMTTPELQPFYDHEELPGADAQTDEELMHWARQQGSTVFHLIGACRMGPDSDPTAVVDDQLRVRGIEGLRVADSSIMPSMPSANTNASTLMIAEKAADMILGCALLSA